MLAIFLFLFLGRGGQLPLIQPQPRPLPNSVNGSILRKAGCLSLPLGALPVADPHLLRLSGLVKEQIPLWQNLSWEGD